MHILDSQYNRVMASTTTQAGEIVRMLRDSLLRRIQKHISIINQEHAKKELYVFCSERDGLAYSFISSYPLTRKEQYDGKSHTIIEFRNSPARMLEFKERESIHFSINLWSIFKYISVSYAYTDLKNEIINLFQEVGISNFYSEIMNPIYLFELYRNIIVAFNIERSIYDIQIAVTFANGLDSCLGIFPPEISTLLKTRLQEMCKKLVIPMYSNVVFSDNACYGADSIRRAFLMSLYSSVRDVNTMLFWHKYRMACQNDNFSGYKVDYNKELESNLPFEDYDKVREFCNKDFFMDKKIYDALFLTLEQTTQITVGMNTMIADSGAIFKTKTHILRNALNNILKACRRVGEHNTTLFYNATETLKGLRENE